MTFTLPHSADLLVLDFQALGLTSRDLDFEKWGLDNVVVAIPSTGYTVDIRPGEVVRSIDFGNRPWRTRGLITKDNPARGVYPKLTTAGHDLHELHALPGAFYPVTCR